MRYRSFLIFLLILVFTVACTGQGVEPKNNTSTQSQVTKTQTKKKQDIPSVEKKPQGYVPGEILVKFKDGTDARAVKAIQTELNLEIIKLVNKPNLYLMRILSGESVERVIKQLQNNKEVKYSEPNYVRSIY